MAERYDGRGAEPFAGGRIEEAQVDREAIRADIRETRMRMSHTLDGIGERLNPNHLTEQVKHNIREATIGRAEHMARNAAGRVTDTRRSIADTVRENPIPAAMVGIGLGWLFYNRREVDHLDRGLSYRAAGLDPAYDDRYYSTRYRDERYYPNHAYGANSFGAGAPGMRDEASPIDRAADWASDRTHSVGERADEMAERTREAVGEMADRTHEALSDTADRARATADQLATRTRYQAHRLEDRLHDAVVDSPLMMGAAALAIGLTAGLAVPSTRREAELMGRSRDRLVDRAEEMADERLDQIEQVARRVAQEAPETLRGAAQELKQTVTESAREEGLMEGAPSEGGTPSAGGERSMGRGADHAGGRTTTGDPPRM